MGLLGEILKDQLVKTAFVVASGAVNSISNQVKKKNEELVQKESINQINKHHNYQEYWIEDIQNSWSGIFSEYNRYRFNVYSLDNKLVYKAERGYLAGDQSIRFYGSGGNILGEIKEKHCYGNSEGVSFDLILNNFVIDTVYFERKGLQIVLKLQNCGWTGYLDFQRTCKIVNASGKKVAEVKKRIGSKRLVSIHDLHDDRLVILVLLVGGAYWRSINKADSI